MQVPGKEVLDCNDDQQLHCFFRKSRASLTEKDNLDRLQLGLEAREKIAKE